MIGCNILVIRHSQDACTTINLSSMPKLLVEETVVENTKPMLYSDLMTMYEQFGTFENLNNYNLQVI